MNGGKPDVATNSSVGNSFENIYALNSTTSVGGAPAVFLLRRFQNISLTPSEQPFCGAHAEKN